MRIGIDAHAVEREGSGNCTYMQNLLLQLAMIDRENEYVLFATNPDHPFYSRFSSLSNFRIHRVPLSPAWYRLFYSIRRATFQEKIDLLHVQYFAPIAPRGRLINTIHDISFYHFPQHFSRFERFMFRLLLPGSSRRSRIILTVSNLSKQDLIQFMQVPDQKIRVTPNGVEEIFRPDSLPSEKEETCKKYHLPERFLLNVGRIDPRKNLMRLVEAYNLLRKNSEVSHSLVIAGKAYFLTDQLKSKIENSEFRNDIYFPGYVSREDLPSLYRSADALIYPSVYEGFGLPPLEAMACGVPVIASNLPIFQEILADAALLIDPFNVNDLAEAMQKLLLDRNLKQSMIEKGLTRAALYQWKQTARATLKAYQEAMNG